jgi:tripartite-type tricarboxylate transporter receptor subunit TctC
MIGTDIVAKSTPDGHTILLSASREMSMSVAHLEKMPYDPVRGFAPVTMLGTSPPVLMVHPAPPVKTIKEVDRARAREARRAQLRDDRRRFTAPLLRRIAQGVNEDRMDARSRQGRRAGNRGRAGRSRVGRIRRRDRRGAAFQDRKAAARAVAQAKRSPSLPDVSTIAETVVPGFDITQWYAIWVPARTAKEIVDRLHHGFVDIAKNIDFKQRWLEAATEVAGATPAELAKLQLAEIEKYKKIAAQAVMQPEQ